MSRGQVLGLSSLVLGNTDGLGSVSKPRFHCFCRCYYDVTADLEIPPLESTRDVARLRLAACTAVGGAGSEGNFRPGRCRGGAAGSPRVSPLLASTAVPPPRAGGWAAAGGDSDLPGACGSFRAVAVRAAARGGAPGSAGLRPSRACRPAP